MNDEQFTKILESYIIGNKDFGNITKYYSDMYEWPETVIKQEDGMYKLNVDTRDLMEEWMDDVSFKVHHLSMADTLLIKSYLKDGKYDEDGKEFLNQIRKRWIEYLKTKK